jgi:hypothetical protein
MSATSPTRRDLIATSAVIGAVSLLPEHVAVAAESNAIRPFRINVSEADLVDLRRRPCRNLQPNCKRRHA